MTETRDLISMLLLVKERLITTGIGEVFLLMGSSIALLTTVIYIGLITSESFIKVEGLDWYKALRPVVIGLVIGSFNYIVIIPMDTLTSLANNYIEAAVEVSKDNITTLRRQVSEKEKNKVQEQLQAYDIKIDATNPEAAKEAEEMFNQAQSQAMTFEDIQESVAQSGPTRISEGFIEKYANRLLIWLVELLGAIAEAYITFLAFFYLMLLTLLGPISFAFGILPAFSSTISQWFARYVHISLYIPLAKIIVFLITNTQELILQDRLNAPELVNPEFVLACLSVVGVIVMFKIPAIAEWIVASGGAGSLNNSINKAAASLGGQIMKIIK